MKAGCIMVSMVYVVSCDICKNQMQMLNANSIGMAFKAVKKLPNWTRNGSNSKHTCPDCVTSAKDNAKIKTQRVGQADDCEASEGKAAEALERR